MENPKYGGGILFYILVNLFLGSLNADRGKCLGVFFLLIIIYYKRWTKCTQRKINFLSSITGREKICEKLQ